MLENILIFFQENFFSGYTLLNTLVYGIVLIIILFFIIKLFEYLKINPKDLIISVIPFIFLGSCIRAFVDNGIYPYNWFLITPGIYFIIGFLTIAALFIGLFIQKKKKIPYNHVMLLIGLFLAISQIINIPSINIIATFQILIIWGILTLFFIIIGKFWKLYNNKLNLSIISAHLFDASSTFIAVDFYGYWEQHVLPNFIYNLSKTALTMFPLKIIVISISLYVIDEYIEDEFICNTLKLAIFILGLAPGIRNFLSLAIGVS